MMFFHRINLIPLAEEIMADDLGILSPFYADSAVLNISVRRSAQLLNLLMRRGPDREYFPDTANLLFILDTLGQEETGKS